MKQINIRVMEMGEVNEVWKLGRKTFKGFESLWVSKPKQAMVAECDGKIVGAILYKFMNIGKKKIGYVDYAFVDQRFHAQGVGKQLYSKTVEWLWKDGCDALSAIVKDDNVASWKLFENLDFTRNTFFELVSNFGFMGAIAHYFKTPLFVSVGMNYFVAYKEKSIKREVNSLNHLFFYFLMNALLFAFANALDSSFVTMLMAYVSILLMGVIVEFLGSRFSSNRNWKFRLNLGGAVVCAFVNFIGLLPMIGNWYPKTYEKGKAFASDMGKVAFFGWFALLVLHGVTSIYYVDSLYLKLMYQLSTILLIYHCIPFYPFESYGGRRVYEWNKLIYGLMFVCSLSLVAMAFMV